MNLVLLSQQVSASNPSFRNAKESLKEWLHQHHYWVGQDIKFSDIYYCEFSDRHFWSCRHTTYKNGYRVLGFHIYDDGEVVLVSRELNE